MAIIDAPKDPGRRELVFFELFFCGTPLAVGGFLQARTGQWLVPGILVGVALLSFLLFRILPRARRLAFIGWFYLTLPIGLLVSHTLLATLYFLVITPIGLLRRLFARGKVSRAPDPSASSYWIEVESDDRVDRYFRQF